MTLGQHFIFFITYKWAQCAKVLVPGKSFLSSLMFKVSLPVLNARVGSCLKQSHYIRLEKLARNKHSGLQCPFVSYE
jgi:hypothetical protein